MFNTSVPLQTTTRSNIQWTFFCISLFFSLTNICVSICIKQHWTLGVQWWAKKLASLPLRIYTNVFKNLNFESALNEKTMVSERETRDSLGDKLGITSLRRKLGSFLSLWVHCIYILMLRLHMVFNSSIYSKTRMYFSHITTFAILIRSLRIVRNYLN